MIMPNDMPDGLTRRQGASVLRLSTLVRVRWLAVIGQSVAILVVAGVLGFQMPTMSAVSLVLASVFLNLALTLTLSENTRLTPWAATCYLGFDMVQLGGLLYLTGGLENPFSVLLIVPVVIAAGSLPLRYTLTLCAVAALVVCVLTLNHRPLPWHSETPFDLPPLFVYGIAAAILSTMAFAVFYLFRVAREANDLAEALAATELVLQRENHLSALDGLAAAAAHELGTPLATISVVAKEMDKVTTDDDPLKEDIALLRSQAARCREILSRLSSLSSESEVHLASMSFSALIEEAVAPHRDFGIRIDISKTRSEGSGPITARRPGVIYGIGNLIENAVDYARSRVMVEPWWTPKSVGVTIIDDGPGFSASVLSRIGEPYTSERPGGSEHAGGLGLGLFIAKTLLERSGARIVFSNAGAAGLGASVEIVWDRSGFEMDAGKMAPPVTERASALSDVKTIL